MFRNSRSRPAKSLWTIVVAGVLLLGVGAVASRIAGPSLLPNLDYPNDLRGFAYETGVPQVLVAIFKMNVLALIQIGFAFLLLLKLQDLVLVKRTKTSQRNWYLMLGVMVVASLTVIGTPPGSTPGEIQTIAIIVAVVFMLVNSFKLSWIVFLSFKDKMATIGLTLLLGMLLLTGFSVTDNSILGDVFVPGAHSYLVRYSHPIESFFSMAVLFGILYSTTAFLSLLFHLPTSAEYTQRAGERATMQSLAHLVGNVFDADRLYATIAAAPVEAGSAHSSWLAIPDFRSGSLTPNLVSAHRMDISQIEKMVDSAALFEEVLQSRAALHLEHAPTDHRVEARPGDGLGSLLITPLIAREEVLGALFSAKEVVRGFEGDDIQTIELLAAQAAVAIDNARLFEQQVERERLSRELSIAREVQQKLLPQRLPSLPGVSIAASSDSAYEVGGDYYDFIRLSRDRLGIIIGDVSGKGTSAAFYMAEMQGIFQSVSRLATTPRDFLKLANTALAHCLDRNVFISVIYGILDIEKEEFILSRAGHCPAAVVGQARKSKFLRSRGLGLGLDRGTLFDDSLEEETVSLEPGDVFALYTDGLVESRNGSGEEYGYERLLEILQNSRHEDADAIHNAILDDLSGFLDENLYDDDMTLLVVKWHGIPLASEPVRVLAAEEST
jgi:serine phosphatase RsbU (regulator of sigma subunit)